MTAVTSIRTKDSSYLLSDSAAFDPKSGAVLGSVTKQTILPHIPVAFAVRGDLQTALAISGLVAVTIATSFAELKSKILGELQRGLSAMFGSVPDDFDLQAVSWSRDNGPESFFITASTIHAVPTWQLIDLGSFAAIPTTRSLQGFDDADFERDPEGSAQRMVETKQKILADFERDPERTARYIADQQRSTVLHLSDGTAGRFVGGPFQLTRVCADGIHTKMLT